MAKRPSDKVRVYVIWQPMLPTDWVRPTTGALARLSDPRAAQFWDRDHALAKQMGRDARPPQPEPECCLKKDILWDLAAIYPKGVTWSDRLPTAALFDGPVWQRKARIGEMLGKLAAE